MAVSYNKLWKLLVDKKMSKSDLRKKAEIAPNTMTKLRRDEEVSISYNEDEKCHRKCHRNFEKNQVTKIKIF